MMALKRGCPVDYRLCNQTVTVYHKDGETYTRKVLSRAFLDFKKTVSVDKVGAREASSFLLVIPCEEPVVFPGDKVLPGEGPEISGREGWAALIPVKVPRLCVVSYVDPKYWRGKLCHEEAGG